jgi:hypothetical protein
MSEARSQRERGYSSFSAEPSTISRTRDAEVSSIKQCSDGAIDVESALRITTRCGILAGRIPRLEPLVAVEDVVLVLPRPPVRRIDGDTFPGPSVNPAFPRATAGKDQGVNVATLDHSER